MGTLPLFANDDGVPESVEHSPRKRHGVHYTPADLASFMARRALTLLGDAPTLVFDPACGDGELLLAVARESQRLGWLVPSLFGVDRDVSALELARQRLADFRSPGVALHAGDFLALGGVVPGDFPECYDLVISNPPYVRTQVLGAKRAQALAQQFGLTGRIDLYHAFIAAMTQSLAESGVLSLLCSNRFLTTKGGSSLRALLARSYEIGEIWDLGDSKMFDAAVLPAVAVARRVRKPNETRTKFVRVYEAESAGTTASVCGSLIDALEGAEEGTVAVGRRAFNIERGTLASHAPDQPWTLTSSSTAAWLGAVRARSAGRFGDFGAVRVGIKTTADTVFIRPAWGDLPEHLRPEPELLHPLITHRVADRWRAVERRGSARTVLYPHEVRAGRRRPVELTSYPGAAAYLEMHRDRLAGRDYVRKAGRAWYEIWVPQQPDAWQAPKLVWPDISEKPRFFLDESGSVVNGDCYWLTCDGRSEDEVALALAVANSSFAVRYYDLCAGNKLYAGRRRFITQYLESLPLPETTPTQLSDVVSMVRMLRTSSDPLPEVEAALDRAVLELFGVSDAH